MLFCFYLQQPNQMMCLFVTVAVFVDNKVIAAVEVSAIVKESSSQTGSTIVTGCCLEVEIILFCQSTYSITGSISFITIHNRKQLNVSQMILYKSGYSRPPLTFNFHIDIIRLTIVEDTVDSGSFGSAID